MMMIFRGKSTQWQTHVQQYNNFIQSTGYEKWLGSRVVSVLDSGAEGHGFKS